ncbi:probable G-protein coupled receptor Mth-like 9 [Drosophila sulfurigaster albostrigata]|uniref:probable G-protein coupled receptor Mth-like 9 n=1 Tax=Drosophila sulfurigaster albostrigata TaxID=89887 RepID=UPI002D21BCEC|nr:probable G-protein coupled receptor Mth-like 9 [Drosophila sulfurigaster albostrigata]
MWATLVGIIAAISVVGTVVAVTETATTAGTTAKTQTNTSSTVPAKYPCAFSDTVNVTDSQRLQDGSYAHEGIVIPAHLVAIYNFKVIDGVEYRAPKHVRGCICLIKPCITFCCPLGEHFNAKSGNCTAPLQPRPPSTLVELTDSAGNISHVKIIDQFVVRTQLGCRNKFVDKKHDSFWQWNLFENGTLLRDDRLWSTDEYCFSSLEHQPAAWELVPLNCERFQRGYRVWIYAICSIIAILINIFILSLLGCINTARKSHYGQLIIYYLLSVIAGYSLLVYLTLKNPVKLSHEACRNVGFLAYFFIMLSFVYLAICSFDFMLKFRKKSMRNWVRTLVYFLAIVFVIILRFAVSFAQDSNLPKHFKPGIGEDYCWFDVRLWGILIYYYVPILLLLIFSLYCCFQTYSATFELDPDTLYLEGVQLRIMKIHFYAFTGYLVGVFAVWLREMIVYILARVREHFFIIDFWSGICILVLAIAGFILLLGKNMHVKTWWSINVESSQTDLSIINARVYKFDEKGDLKNPDSPYRPTVTSL